jgi:hypothetical protein
MGNRLRRAQVDGPRQFARGKKDTRRLVNLSKKATISLTSGVADKPSDFARVISIGTVSS